MRSILKKAVRRAARNEVRVHKLELDARVRDLEDKVRDLRREAENRRRDAADRIRAFGHAAESRRRDAADRVRAFAHAAEIRRHEAEIRRLERKLYGEKLPLDLCLALIYNALAVCSFLTGSRKKRWIPHVTGLLLLIVSAFHFMTDFAVRRAEDL